ncbi:MAG: GAF domain-containing protein [Myxococcales bacterium]
MSAAAAFAREKDLSVAAHLNRDFLVTDDDAIAPRRGRLDFLGLATTRVRHYVPGVAIEAWLKSFLSTHSGVAGTVHLLEGDVLKLKSSVNIPPPVIKVTERIPKGKGMAGLAWERDEVVAVCNLKSDASGDVRPGAKAVDAQAALAIPVRSSAGGLRAVVGIAFLGERDFSPEQLQAFEAAAASLPDAG